MYFSIWISLFLLHSISGQNSGTLLIMYLKLNLPEIKENATAAYADDDGAELFDGDGNLNQTTAPVPN